MYGVLSWGSLWVSVSCWMTQLFRITMWVHIWHSMKMRQRSDRTSALGCVWWHKFQAVLKHSYLAAAPWLPFIPFDISTVCSVVLLIVIKYLQQQKFSTVPTRDKPSSSILLSRLPTTASEVPWLGRRWIHRGSGFLLRGHPDHLLCHLCVHPVPWHACG